MHSSRALLLVAAVALITVVSGCTTTGPSTGATGNGVVIENFEADFPQAFAGEKIQLQARVRNVGSVKAQNLRATVLGLDWQGCSLPAWEMKDLLAPDAVRGTAGESQTKIWQDCQVPGKDKVPAGLSITANPTLRLYYEISSHVLKSVTFASPAELRRIQNLNQALPAETLSATASPVALSIETKGPIRVFEDGVEFPVEVKLTNVGGGVACSGSRDDCQQGGHWNEVKLKIGVASGLQLQDCETDRTVVLWRGQSNSVVCTVKASGVDIKAGTVQKIIEASATYVYFVEKPTTIMVTGR